MLERSHLQMAKLWRRWIVLPALFCLCFIHSEGAVHEMGPSKEPPRGSRELIVKFKPGADPAQKTRALKNSARVELMEPRAKAFRAAAEKRPPFHRIEVQQGVEVEAELARLRLNPSVEFVEPNYPVKILALTNAIFPDDFEFSKMYSLHNPGGDNAKTNADVKAPAAWRFTTGDKDVLVAVIDTGIDYLHEDLRENIWVNPGEVPFNGLDDDENGFVDDYNGYDFVSYDSDPFDDNQHGTHVAGTIGAKGNNGIGTVGVCWDVSLMAIKAFDENGNGTVADAIAAIHYAVENGAGIINASWGLEERSRALEEAAKFAADAGVLVIAAAGNSRTDAPSYRASFETVLSVAATDARDARAAFSNYGEYVDVAAPGENIISTLPENSYGFLSGTSMATPHVSGMAALVLARFPNYGREELFDILVNSVEVMLFDQPIGRGRIDLSIAVQMDQPLPTARLRVEPTVSGVVDVAGNTKGTYFSGYSVRVGAGRNPTNWIEIAASNARATNALMAQLDTALVPDGAAFVRLVVTNVNGASAIAQAPVRVFNGLITYPLAGDVLAPVRYDVRGTVHGAGKTFELSYGAGLNPEAWTSISSGVSGAIDAVIGQWDATELETGHYQLRLVVSNGTSRAEFSAPVIYIHRRLKPGWPAYARTDGDFPATEWRNVRPADLDGDGKSELVLVDAGTRNFEQQLRVFNLDGTLRWARALGFDIPPDLPAIGDIDDDGRMEIFVDGTNGIVAFHHDGSIVEGWPVQTLANNHAKVLADLDQDGALELIAYSQEYAATQVAEMRELSIFRSDGSVLRSWSLPWCGFTNDVQKIFPAVANLDANSDLEIVVPSGCSEIMVLDHDHQEAQWRANVVGEILSSPVVGDVDGNGEQDVIVAVSAYSEDEPGGIYVFDGRGQRWHGWPMLEEFSFTSAPALGDLDGDGRLEIAAVDTALSAFIHVLQWDGFQTDGWPASLKGKTSSRLGLSIADINNDEKPDVIASVPGYPAVAITLRDPEYLGGVMAWDFSGGQILLDGAPMLFESSSPYRFQKAAPVILEDLDGNGRLDFVLSSIQDRTYGSLTKYKDRSSIYAWEVSASAGTVEWPMFGHDVRNSGAYSLPLFPAPMPTNITRAIRDRVIVGEDRELRIEPLVNDWNATGQPLEMISITPPTNGVAVLDGNAIVYRPGADYTGLDGFSYTMRDAGGRTSTGEIVVRVKPLNDPPVAENIDLTVNKNSSVSVFYTGTDAEGEKLNFRILAAPQHGEIWNYPNVGNYHPHKGYSGVDTFTYVANDGRLDSLPATVTITVLNSNNPPKAVSQELLTKTNRSLLIAPGGTDPDSDPLTFEIVQSTSNGALEPEGARYRYTPNKDFVGEDSFTFRAFDGTVFGGEARITIGVIATNATPSGVDGNATVQPNSSTRLKLSGEDPDGDSIQFVIMTEPLHGTISGVPPEVTYTPETNYLGPDRFEFKVTDSFDESPVATFTLEVMRQNRAPVAKDQAVDAGVNEPVAFVLEASDPDEDTLRTVILKGPSQGLVYGSGTNFIYVPKPGALGADVFTYKLWDGQKFGNVGRVTMMISPAPQDRPPAFTSISEAGGVVTLVLDVPAGKSFSVEASTNLVNWNVLSGPMVSPSTKFQLSDTNRAGEARFYRAVRH